MLVQQRGRGVDEFEDTSDCCDFGYVLGAQPQSSALTVQLDGQVKPKVVGDTGPGGAALSAGGGESDWVRLRRAFRP